MGMGLGILNLVWWFAFGYGMGSKPPEEYTYIMGLPMWFFMSCVVGGLLFTILAIIMVTKFFKNMPLERMTAEEAKNYEMEVN
ncbi:MAG: YhdT family protein [Alkaliphilus sp.]|nr:YhdT family protein [Alkaliphilus sp.]